MTDEGQSLTHHFSISGHKAYVTVATDEQCRSILLEIRVVEAVGVLGGGLDALAASFSLGLCRWGTSCSGAPFPPLDKPCPPRHGEGHGERAASAPSPPPGPAWRLPTSDGRGIARIRACRFNGHRVCSQLMQSVLVRSDPNRSSSPRRPCRDNPVYCWTIARGHHRRFPGSSRTNSNSPPASTGFLLTSWNCL